MKQILSLIVLCAVLAPLSVAAETVFRSGTDININTGQLIDGDYYVSVGPFSSTTMSGEINGDMYAVGGAVTLNGSVNEDVSILAATADVHAIVSDDVRIAAGEVTIAQSVGGDVFVLAGTLEILSTAEIAGNLYFFGGSAIIDGNVAGAIYGSAELITINGSVGGNVTMRAPAGLTLGDSAVIGGALQYSSVVPLVRSQGAVVEGEVTEQTIAAASTREQIRAVATPYFIVVFAALTIFLLFKDELQGIAQRPRRYARHLIIGAGVLVAGPIVALLLMVTVLGSLLGVTLMGLLMMLYALSIALAGIVFGYVMSQTFLKDDKVSMLTVLLGTTTLQILLFVPLFGLVLYIIVLLYTLGLLTHVFIQTSTKA